MWCRLLLLVPLVIAGLLAFLLWTTALLLAMGLAMSMALVVYATWRAKCLPGVIGAEGLRGRRAEAVSDLNPGGLVHLCDEVWLAEARQPVAQDRAVEVIEVVGARVRVRPWT